MTASSVLRFPASLLAILHCRWRSSMRSTHGRTRFCPCSSRCASGTRRSVARRHRAMPPQVFSPLQSHSTRSILLNPARAAADALREQGVRGKLQAMSLIEAIWRSGVFIIVDVQFEICAGKLFQSTCGAFDLSLSVIYLGLAAWTRYLARTASRECRRSCRAAPPEHIFRCLRVR